MFECMHCGCRAVIWDSDFNADEYGYMDDPDGLVHVCHCCECGAEVIYYIRGTDDEEKGEEE